TDGRLFALLADNTGANGPPGPNDALFVVNASDGKVIFQVLERDTGFNSLHFIKGDLLTLCRPGAWGRTRDAIVLMDARTGKELHTFDGGSCHAFSLDGRLLAVGDEKGEIRVTDVASRKPLVEWKGHRNAVTALAFSRDGKTLVSGGGKTWPLERFQE